MSLAALLLFVRTLGLTLPLWLVAGWSAAEATIFFIVADVPISWIAVRSGTRAAMLAAVVAAMASVAGTILVYWWVRHDAAGAAATMASLPGIDGAMLAQSADHYRHGLQAVLAGSFEGIPFKTFALAAAKTPDWAFLLLAPLLRLPRFVGVALVSGGLSRLLERWLTMRQRLALLLLVWIAFYAAYFSAMPR